MKSSARARPRVRRSPVFAERIFDRFSRPPGHRTWSASQSKRAGASSGQSGLGSLPAARNASRIRAEVCGFTLNSGLRFLPAGGRAAACTKLTRTAQGGRESTSPATDSTNPSVHSRLSEPIPRKTFGVARSSSTKRRMMSKRSAEVSDAWRWALGRPEHPAEFGDGFLGPVVPRVVGGIPQRREESLAECRAHVRVGP